MSCLSECRFDWYSRCHPAVHIDGQSGRHVIGRCKKIEREVTKQRLLPGGVSFLKTLSWKYSATSCTRGRIEIADEALEHMQYHGCSKASHAPIVSMFMILIPPHNAHDLHPCKVHRRRNWTGSVALIRNPVQTNNLNVSGGPPTDLVRCKCKRSRPLAGKRSV